MDKNLKSEQSCRDDPVWNLSAFLRYFPAQAPVGQVGHALRKPKGYRNYFDGAMFNIFVFEGNGILHIAGKNYFIIAPALLVCEPQHKGYFEVTSPKGWEEYWVMYRPVDRAILAARGLLPANGPIVDFAKPSEIRDWLDKAMALGAEATTFGIVDVIDRHCELAAIGALLQKQENVENTTLQTIIQIREQIVQTPTVPIDVEALAEANGLSRSTFLQQWNTLVGEPPKRHIDRMRMALACSMLTGTYQSINAIATELGFGDPLHFSRRFRQLIGQPPSEYRQTHRMDRNSK